MSLGLSHLIGTADLFQENGEAVPFEAFIVIVHIMEHSAESQRRTLHCGSQKRTHSAASILSGTASDAPHYSTPPALHPALGQNRPIEDRLDGAGNLTAYLPDLGALAIDLASIAQV